MNNSNETRPSSDLPRYKCHKEVHALKIKSVEWIDGGRKLQITPADSGFSAFTVDEGYARKHQPKAGGYYVVYADGYKSFSPAKAFEEGYSLVGVG